VIVLLVYNFVAYKQRGALSDTGLVHSRTAPVSSAHTTRTCSGAKKQTTTQ